jgi:hypothetical protein
MDTISVDAVEAAARALLPHAPGERKRIDP